MTPPSEGCAAWLASQAAGLGPRFFRNRANNSSFFFDHSHSSQSYFGTGRNAFCNLQPGSYFRLDNSNSGPHHFKFGLSYFCFCRPDFLDGEPVFSFCLPVFCFAQHDFRFCLPVFCIHEHDFCFGRDNFEKHRHNSRECGVLPPKVLDCWHATSFGGLPKLHLGTESSSRLGFHGPTWNCYVVPQSRSAKLEASEAKRVHAYRAQAPYPKSQGIAALTCWWHFY